MPTYNLCEIRYRSLRVTVEQIFAVYRSRSRFLPEQSRPDRDEYVTIYRQNIVRGTLAIHFTIHSL